VEDIGNKTNHLKNMCLLKHNSEYFSFHTLAQLIFELVMVRDGEWSLSDSNFTKDDISAAIEHLCTV